MGFKDPEIRRAYHRAYSVAYVRKIRARRKADGVCIYCRTPVQRFTACVPCRRARSAYYAEVIKPRLAALSHRCLDCRRTCLRPTSLRCQPCQCRRAAAARWKAKAA